MLSKASTASVPYHYQNNDDEESGFGTVVISPCIRSLERLGTPAKYRVRSGIYGQNQIAER
jgi:hypothetical protein